MAGTLFIICAVCGKATKAGRHTPDDTVRYPRRHKGQDGLPCPGNIIEGVWETRPR